jgi:5-hydroxyisourate hydrolase-like protein (transthyretin family)
MAATPITGTVTDKTTGKPAAGDDVTLIRLAQGMQESTHTKTDARGRYKLDVPDDGLHLVRVTHDKANYFHPVQPGTTSADVDVYDAAPEVEGVSTAVLEYHLEATGNQLNVVEVMQVLNHSAPPRTQFGPDGFQFYLPTEAAVVRTGAITDQGMPIQTPAVPVGDLGHYKFLFPIRPGETQFGIIYTLPYTGSLTLYPKLATPVATMAILVPKSMKVKPGPSSPFVLTPDNNPSADTYIAQHVSPSQPLDFTVSGTGQLPRDAEQGAQQNSPESGAPVAATDNKLPGKGLDNPLDPEGDRDPWGKYKWWIVGGLALLLAAAAGILLRKPAASASAPETEVKPPENHLKRLLDTLKEELFALETDHLQGKIDSNYYAEHKAALELILRRALTHSPTAASVSTSSTT